MATINSFYALKYIFPIFKNFLLSFSFCLRLIFLFYFTFVFKVSRCVLKFEFVLNCFFSSVNLCRVLFCTNHFSKSKLPSWGWATRRQVLNSSKSLQVVRLPYKRQLKIKCVTLTSLKYSRTHIFIQKEPPVSGHN